MRTNALCHAVLRAPPNFISIYLRSISPPGTWTMILDKWSRKHCGLLQCVHARVRVCCVCVWSASRETLMTRPGGAKAGPISSPLACERLPHLHPGRCDWTVGPLDEKLGEVDLRRRLTPALLDTSLACLRLRSVGSPSTAPPTESNDLLLLPFADPPLLQPSLVHGHSPGVISFPSASSPSS
jgi:hypothetical protein